MKPSVALGLTASALAIGAAMPAAAQQFYVGGGLDYGQTSLSSPLPDDGHLSTGSVLAGVTVPMGQQFYLGAELDTSLGANYSTDYGDTVDNITRLRAVAGYRFPTYSVFATLGAVQVKGALFDGDNGTSKGTTFSLGADVPVTGNLDLRFEVIRDQVDLFNVGYRWDNTSARVAAVYRF
ncbi:MAG: outer membrane beta-barrel protein [Limimaricola sp.]|uniref:outer membrane beta-barrel protein n=1 Tax=Limimaricola sp. TaxID=2211665 RepID=UPI001DEFD4B0|nr:outer membrane beta-barrel protein [Limimaricola sp.]MBI1416255.1 outer membrane beta-barrel protein [Limimaricola sp.]